MKQRLAENIAKARKNAGLKQKELASRAKVHERTIQQIEQSIVWPGYETLSSIALALDCEVEDFFHFNSPEREPRKFKRGLNSVDRTRLLEACLKLVQIKVELGKIQNDIVSLLNRHPSKRASKRPKQ